MLRNLARCAFVILYFAVIAAIAWFCPFLCYGQTLFGTNAGTFADYFPTYAMNSVALRGFGTAANPFGPDAGVQGPNGSLVANFGSVTYAQNYPSGTYLVTFDSPSPVSLSYAGFWSGGAVTRSGTRTTQLVTLQHDNGNPKAGMGWFTTGGVSSSNPVSNFTITQQGTAAADLTAPFRALQDKYQGTRYMNNLNVNNNTSPMTASSLVPSGYNAGQNSYADVVRWTNGSARQRAAMIEIPVNADASFVAQVAKTMSGLAAGKELIVEYGNEVWNYGFSQAGWMQNAAAGDGRVTAGDGFGRNAQEYGLRAYSVMQTFRANFTGPATLHGFLGSQASNTYYVDQAKAAIKNAYGASAVADAFYYQGVGFYPTDNLTGGASSAQDLYNKIVADLPRVTGYLKADVANAKASGLNELVYEWSPNGYLTQGGVSQSVIDAFRASDLSRQAYLATWDAIANNVGANGAAFSFTLTGDGWGPQVDPLGAAEPQQLAVNAISAALPEPSSCLAAAAVVYCGLSRRRRRRGRPTEKV